jgi:archaellum biogenesis protein FlaJ (TadC family)
MEEPMLTQTTVIFVLAFLAESLTEYLLKPVYKKFVPEEEQTEQPPVDTSTVGLLVRYSSALVGVALCILYQVDVLGMMGLVTNVPVVPYAITGLIIGRGSNFVHDFAKRWLTPA